MAAESVSAAPAKAMPAPMNVKTPESVAAAIVTQPPAAATSMRVPSSTFTYRHFMGGAVGGMTAALITSPLEVVKTRLQIRGGSGSFGTQTTFGVMRSIGRTESVYGLWRGITPTLVGVIPARAIYFGSYSTFKEKFTSYGLNGQVETSVAAKARPQFSSVRQVALDMYRKEGPRAFFRGLSASYWGISESAIQFALYEECKDHIEEPTNLKYFLAAGACKLLASMCTYPHEVVRTRMRDQRAPLDSKDLKYKSMIQSIIKIYKEEGRRGLYSGMPAHLMRVVPNAAILFMVVEVVANKE
ncbi:Mitochondrial Carrier (MC) Family [Phytophthora nicotianae]|uniref:Mitochondrial Carrier (MC) Family n=1 Tax=Phytophthora nicotianae TaxID=4792 RepID=A0A0W8C7L3_PHYNI|nr:Mitochondrial Carrier (MC) Family [Phytophthora nicotianae]